MKPTVAASIKKAKTDKLTRDQCHKTKFLPKNNAASLRHPTRDQRQKKRATLTKNNKAASLPNPIVEEPSEPCVSPYVSEQQQYPAPTIGEEMTSNFEEVHQVKLEPDIDCARDQIDSVVCTNCLKNPFVLDSISLVDNCCQTEDDDLSHELELCRRENDTLRLELNYYQSQALNKLNPLDVNSLEKNDSLVHFYTGFSNFALLKTYFNFSSKFVKTSNSDEVFSKLAEFLLVMMKLRLNLPFRDLALRFNVDEATAFKTFVKWVEGMFVASKQLIIWPRKEKRASTMPLNFKRHFGNSITAIIDCFEICIQRPSLLKAQAQTWSHKRGLNTIKFLISATPQGNVNFISNSWGGLASERQIAAESGFLDHLKPGDVLMADQGFSTLEDLLAPLNCSLAIPSQTPVNSHSSVDASKKSLEIRHLKSQVNQFIGELQDKFKILVERVPIEMLATEDGDDKPLIDKIAYICCGLVNITRSVYVMT